MEGPYDPKELNLLIRNKIDLVVHSFRQIDLLQGIQSLPREIKVWIKLDTGMNRLGFKEEEGYEQISEEKDADTSNETSSNTSDKEDFI